MLHSVAQRRTRMQLDVAQRFQFRATVSGMETWKEWRKRAKDWKKDNKLTDADIAAGIPKRTKGVGKYEVKVLPPSRAQVQAWLMGRYDPDLTDFLALCEAMGADPGHILFGEPILRRAVRPGTKAHEIVTASPTAYPGHAEFVKKLHTQNKNRKFKMNRTKHRRPILK